MFAQAEKDTVMKVCVLKCVHTGFIILYFEFNISLHSIWTFYEVFCICSVKAK